jgi:hypothetical protein
VVPKCPVHSTSEWLVAPIDLRKAESAIAPERRDEWEYIKRRMLPDDEVWQYVATLDSPAAAGFALVRRGAPYDGIFLGFRRHAN